MPYDKLKAFLNDQIDSAEELESFVDTLSDSAQDALSEAIEDKKAQFSSGVLLAEATGSEILDAIEQRDNLQALVADKYSAEANTKDEESNTEDPEKPLWSVEVVPVSDDSDARKLIFTGVSGVVQTDAEETVTVEDGETAEVEAEGTPTVHVIFEDEEGDEAADDDDEDKGDEDKGDEDLEGSEEEEATDTAQLPEALAGFEIVDEGFDPEAARERLLQWVSDSEDHTIEEVSKLFLASGVFSTEDADDDLPTYRMEVPIGDVVGGELKLNRNALADSAERLEAIGVQDETITATALSIATQTKKALGLTKDTSNVPQELLEAAQRLGVQDADDLGYEQLLVAVRDHSASANASGSGTPSQSNSRTLSAREILNRVR